CREVMFVTLTTVKRVVFLHINLTEYSEATMLHSTFVGRLYQLAGTLLELTRAECLNPFLSIIVHSASFSSFAVQSAICCTVRVCTRRSHISLGGGGTIQKIVNTMRATQTAANTNAISVIE